MRTSRGLSDCLGLLGTLHYTALPCHERMPRFPNRRSATPRRASYCRAKIVPNSRVGADKKMSNYEHITYEPRGAVVLITLNRPEKLNAWTPKMELEFIDAVNSAAADGEIGCVVISGAGRGFCAG